MIRRDYILYSIALFFAIMFVVLAYNFLAEHLDSIFELIKNRRVINPPFIEILEL